MLRLAAGRRGREGGRRERERECALCLDYWYLRREGGGGGGERWLVLFNVKGQPLGKIINK